MKLHDFMQEYVNHIKADKGIGIDTKGAGQMLEDLFELAIMSHQTAGLLAELIGDGLADEAKEMAGFMRDGILARLADTLATNVTQLDGTTPASSQISEQQELLAKAMKSFSGSC